MVMMIGLLRCTTGISIPDPRQDSEENRKGRFGTIRVGELNYGEINRNVFDTELRCRMSTKYHL
jgi:hypothetical protein